MQKNDKIRLSTCHNPNEKTESRQRLLKSFGEQVIKSLLWTAQVGNSWIY